jgi:hypothetical protein
MFLSTLPFDYAALLDPGDRIRMPVRRQGPARRRSAGAPATSEKRQ